MWKAFRVKQSLENGITEEKNKSGFRKKLISVQLLIVLVAVMLFCSGCAGKMNAKKIFRQSSENMQKVTDKVQNWVKEVASDKGWDEVKFAGGQCILENKFLN